MTEIKSSLSLISKENNLMNNTVGDNSVKHEQMSIKNNFLRRIISQWYCLCGFSRDEYTESLV